MIKRYMKITAVRLKISQNKLKQEKALVSDSATNAVKPRPAVPFGSGAVSGGAGADLVSSCPQVPMKWE